MGGTEKRKSRHRHHHGGRHYRIRDRGWLDGRSAAHRCGCSVTDTIRLLADQAQQAKSRRASERRDVVVATQPAICFPSLTAPLGKAGDSSFDLISPRSVSSRAHAASESLAFAAGLRERGLTL